PDLLKSDGSTTGQPEDEPEAADGLAGVLVGDVGNPVDDGGVSGVIILFVAVGVLIAGGAAFLWVRTARNLIR
ncbi:MAG: hypothetical protein GY778_14530, partial [bacterium]|nr:hypothetical protein [bacterium]